MSDNPEVNQTTSKIMEVVNTLAKNGAPMEDISALTQQLLGHYKDFNQAKDVRKASLTVKEVRPEPVKKPLAKKLKTESVDTGGPVQIKSEAKATPAPESDSQTAILPPKRKRGRPRKNPIVDSEAIKEEVIKVTKRKPCIPIEESVTDEAVRCLICGKSMKMLKRHLNQAHNMTPEHYKAAFGLSKDHPLTAPNYTKQKSQYAKITAFGSYDRDKEIASA